jgi:hypothetical protein
MRGILAFGSLRNGGWSGCDIDEIRNDHAAELAEREILHQADVRAAQSPDDVANLDDEMAQDRDRLARERDRECIGRIKA